jgi:uncharacterized membrane protein
MSSLVAEKERSERLSAELERSAASIDALQKELTMARQSILSKDSEISALKRRMSELEVELEKTLKPRPELYEAFILSYIREHRGRISLAECSKEIGLPETNIRDILENLQDKGKIRLEN